MNSAQPLAARIATLVQAIQNCERSGNAEWRARHTAELERLAREYLPSGSGFNHGTNVVIGRSSAHRIVMVTSYHHMDENGFYDGWTTHDVIANATFTGPDIRVAGIDRNGIKDYIAEVFQSALTQLIAE